MGIEIRLLGGFRVETPGDGGARFESQKVRALLAYLALHPDSDVTRDHLAELLWPDSDPNAGRRNLRQALYNLRQALGERGSGMVRNGRSQASVRLHLDDDDFLDVAAFLVAWRRGLPGGDEVVAGELAAAAELYRGDLLAGFLVRDSFDFESWLLTEQERFRDAAVQTFRALVEHFSTRGDFDAAVNWCHRLLAIDPLSEEAHRELIRLHVLAGRRRRALARYEELEKLLQRELGVEPMPQSRKLYESILAEELPLPGSGGQGGAPSVPPPAPFVPLVGRGEAIEALRESWRRAAADGARLALVEGEPGVGRTRLVRFFLNQVSSQHRASVVQGRCGEEAPWSAGEPLAGALDGLRARMADEGRPAPADDVADDGPLDRRLTAAVRAALAPLPEPGPPLILFLDDVHLASATMVDLILEMLESCADRALWIAATAASGSTAARRLGAHRRVDPVLLTRLDDPDVVAICRTLLGEHRDHAALAQHLFRASEGLPLALVENVNSLCDHGLLEAVERQHWKLKGEPRAVEATPEELERLIVERVEHLPTSARRLLTLATVAGASFDVELLQRAAREHIDVVEIGIELMLERWLVRQHAHRWTEDPRERDLVLWAQGARRGSFEFAHPAIRRAVYEDLAPGRRRVLHREVAEVLAERYEPGPEAGPERIARHYTLAGEPAAALPYLRAAAERAERLGDTAAAAALRELAAKAGDDPAQQAG